MLSFQTPLRCEWQSLLLPACPAFMLMLPCVISHFFLLTYGAFGVSLSCLISHLSTLLVGPAFRRTEHEDFSSSWTDDRSIFEVCTSMLTDESSILPTFLSRFPFKNTIFTPNLSKRILFLLWTIYYCIRTLSNPLTFYTCELGRAGIRWTFLVMQFDCGSSLSIYYNHILFQQRLLVVVLF